MKRVFTLGTLFIVLLIASCKQNNCTCEHCLNPADTTKCCPADDNTGGGCYGAPTPVQDVIPYNEYVDPNTLEGNFEDDNIEFVDSPIEEEYVPEDHHEH